MLKRAIFLMGCCSLVLAAAGTSLAESDFHCDFLAQLSASTVGPKPAQTDANGEVYFFLSPDGNELAYQVVVDQIEDVYMAHLHVGPKNHQGPIVVWLYPAKTERPTRSTFNQGELASGVIYRQQLRGPLAGMTLAELVEALQNGQAYVNIHTNKHIMGELRGQVYPTFAGY